jgi:signal transduction histidine kinase
MGVVALLLGLFYRQLALNDLIDLAESNNVSLTVALSNSLWPQFAPYVASVPVMSGDELRGRPETAKLRQAVLEMMQSLSVVKVKVYNLQGLTVFSTQASQIGEDKSANSGFLSARSGKVASELTHRDTFSAFEQTIEDRDIISSYIPIRSDPAGPVEGIFELYHDVTPFLQKLRHTQKVIVICVMLLFALLYGVLFVIVRRADGIIGRQDIEGKRYLDEIEKANETLEERVRMRTQELSRANRELEFEIGERKQAQEKTQRHLQRITALREINLASTSSLDLGAVLNLLLEKTDRLLPVIAATTVRLFNKQTGKLEPVACRNLNEEQWKTETKNGGSLDRMLPENNSPLMVLNAQTDPRSLASEFLREHGLVSFLRVPLTAKNDTLGVITFFTKVEHRFSDEEIDFLSTVSGQAAIALHNARLYEETASAKRELEDANSTLKKQAVELERSNAELEQFAYVASHDLQEPLRMVASYTQLLAKRYQGRLDGDADEFIAYAVDGVTRMQSQIQDLLSYSKLGKKNLQLESTDCSAILGRALVNLKVAIEESAATVTSDPLPPVMADGNQLAQLFQNLIGNAVKFRNHRRPLIHVSARRSGQEWLFSVRDNGIGFEPQFAERIFVIFQRLHAKGDHPGTGIGLAVCKKIVQRHGGRIWAEAEPGKGAIFYFTIPA